jgi:ferredoxin
MMKVTIDFDRCSGQGRCYVVASEVYQSDSDGFNKDRGCTIEVPPGCEEAALLGAQTCPEKAIDVVNDVVTEGV